MPGMNIVIIVGRLGQEPDIRKTQSGDTIANMSVATSETWRDKQSGDKREKTEWHKVSVFGKAAEVVEKYVNKGDRIGVYGKLQTRKWQDKNGQDRWTTEVVVSGYDGKIDLMGDNGGGNDSGRGNRASSGRSSETSQAEIDDEIPF